MEWTVVLAGPARKALKRVPTGDRTRMLAALGEMQQNPFQGDIRKLPGAARLPSARGKLAYSLRGRTRAQSHGRRCD
jgi:hypothetical protein